MLSYRPCKYIVLLMKKDFVNTMLYIVMIKLEVNSLYRSESTVRGQTQRT